jgi:FkbM family methyltransferase
MNWRERLLILRSSLFGEHLIRAFDIDLKVNLPNVSFPVFLQLSKNLSELITPGGGKENAERELFRTVAGLHHIKSFWDIGANIGQYTWEFLSLPGERHAVLIEPDPRNIATISKTIAMSRLTNCDLMRTAVSDFVGQISFNLDPITGKQGSIRDDAQVSRLMARYIKPLTVRCETVDHLLEGQHLPPDVIKIDVEGAEKQVLAGAIKTLRRNRPILFIEVTAANFPDVETMLKNLGYQLHDAVTRKTAAPESFNVIAVLPALHANAIETAKLHH